MKARPDTRQIGIRLPVDVLKSVDQSAEENERDRTREITHALRQYYQQMEEKKEILNIIEALTEKVEALEKEVKEMKGSQQ